MCLRWLRAFNGVYAQSFSVFLGSYSFYVQPKFVLVFCCLFFWSFPSVFTNLDNLPCSFPPPQVNSHIHLLCCTKINLPSSIFSSPLSFFTFSYTGAPRSHEQQLWYIQCRESTRWFLPSHLCEYANWTFFKGYKMAIFFSHGYKLGKKRERELEKERQ